MTNFNNLEEMNQYRLNAIKERIEILQARIEARQQQPVKDWAQVGDLGHIVELLSQILEVA